jgi:hypothetical protein
MIDLDLTEALRELDSQYEQLPISKNWNDPTREQMIASLNKAHKVNKALIRNLNMALKALLLEQKRRKQVMWAFGATWATIVVVLKWLIPYALKGMLLH